MQTSSAAVMATNTTKPEIFSLTSLRAFAALAVVLFHFSGSFGPATYPINKHSGILEYGYIGVDFFFLLSGFILYYVYRDEFRAIAWTTLNDFLIARLARLYPLHLFTLLIWLAATGVVSWLRQKLEIYGGFYHSTNDVATFVENLLLIHAWPPSPLPTWNRPAWSISAEWFAYLLFPALSVFFFRLRSVVSVLAVATMAYGLLLGASVRQGTIAGIDNLPALHPLLRIGPEFVIGMCACRLLMLTNASRLSGCVVDALLVLCAAAILVCAHFGLPDPLAVLLLVGIIGLTSLEAGAIGRFLKNRVLVYLGRISYSIYMVHYPLRTLYVEVAKPIVGKTLSQSYALSLLATVFMIALTIALAALTYRYIETPGRRYLRRYSWRRRSVAGHAPMAERS